MSDYLLTYACSLALKIGFEFGLACLCLLLLPHWLSFLDRVTDLLFKGLCKLSFIIEDNYRRWFN